MRKLIFSSILFAIFSATLIISPCFAALTAPNFADVQNYSGDLVVFWDTGANDVAGSEYRLYFSTSSLNTLTTTQIYTGTVIHQESETFDGSGPENMYKAWRLGTNGPTDGETYFVRIAVCHPTSTDVILSPEKPSVTCIVEKIIISNIYTAVDGYAGQYLINFDSSSLTFSADLTGEYGSPFFDPAYVLPEIQVSIDGVAKAAYSWTKSSINVVVSSSNFSAKTSTFTWDGAVAYTDWHQYSNHKHNGWYTIALTPVNKDDESNTGGIGYKSVGVDVVHFNPKELVYQSLGSDQVHYGPPFQLNYYLSKSCFFTWKIWDRNQTITTTDDSLVKVVISSAPRHHGDWAAWDDVYQSEIWDGRNEQGLIVSNDIYRYTIDAIEFWDEPGSNFDPSITDISYTFNGTITFDVLRLVDVSATGITDDSSLAHIKYTLAGANSEMGGANIKIVICSPGTTFYMSTSSGTLAYLSGGASYYYLAGDPMVHNANNIKKVFTFDRTAGDQDETWNGYDDAGSALANDNYVFAISATDDSGNHAIDNTGNDRVIIGNITIDRTAAQEAGDSDPPTVTSISVGGTSISLSTTTTLSIPFTTIAVTLTDTGSAGVDLTDTSISLTNPSGVSISPSSTANDSIGTITITYAQQSTNGTYSIRITPEDQAGNTGSEVIYTFAVSITQAGVEQAFQESVVAYPNPAKNVASLTFEYDISSISQMTLEVYNVLGELIYNENWTPTATGTNYKVWGIVNNGGQELATGVYLYRLTSEAATNKELKKIVIVQ